MLLRRALLAAMVVSISGGIAHAQDPLAPLQAYSPVPNKSFFGGTLVQTETTPFSATSGLQSISGNLISAVYDPDGNAATEGFDFYYQFLLSSSSTSAVDQVNIFGFTGASIFDSGEILGSSFGPFSSSTVEGFTLSRSSSGGSVRIEFGGPSVPTNFDPGDASGIYVFRVSNGAFSPNGNASVTGINAVAANTNGIVFTPVDANLIAPEPGSAILLAAGGLLGAAVLRRRRAIR
jgi:hypothetical protein